MSENFKQELFEAILSLKNTDECLRFFSDLCTEKEVSDLSARLRVARLLDSGANYNDIAAETGASTATISRVSKALSGAAGGYRTVLERDGSVLVNSEKLSNMLDSKSAFKLGFVYLMSSAGFTLVDVPSYMPLKSLTDAADTSRLVVFQDVSGELLVLTPDAKAAVLSTEFDTACDIQSFIYSAKQYERCYGEIKCEEVIGAVCRGALTREERYDILKLALSVIRLRSANAQLSVFNQEIFNLIFKENEVSEELEEKLCEIINSQNEKQLLKLANSGEISEELKRLLSSLIKLPQNPTAAAARLFELLPDKKYLPLVSELEDLALHTDKKRCKIEAKCLKNSHGIVFTASQYALCGEISAELSAFEVKLYRKV